MKYNKSCLMTHLLLLLLFAANIAYCDDTVSLNQVMSFDDMDKTGVSNLSDDEKKNLEQWITQWTQKVIDQSKSYHPGITIPNWVASWPAYAKAVQNQQPTPAQENKLDKERAAANRIIDMVQNDGGTITLKDGSVWTISPYDTHKTRTWQRGDKIGISTTNNVWRPYRLMDYTQTQVADAELTQAAAPSGEIEPKSPSYYEGAVGISKVQQSGQVVVLQDNTAWAIAPQDQVRTQNWKKNDRVRVESSDDYLYSYYLSNLDSGEKVLANDLSKE